MYTLIYSLPTTTSTHPHNTPTQPQTNTQPLPRLDESTGLSFYQRSLLRNAIIRWRLAVLDSKEDARDDDDDANKGVECSVCVCVVW